LLNCSKQIFILNVNNNRIVNLPEKSSKLKINRFHCSSNLIEKIPNELWMIRGLETIDLSKNLIKKIPACNSKIDLYDMNLSSNNISRLDNDLFLNTKLCNVNISNNNILELPNALIEKKEIRELDISNNKLTNFPDQILNRNLDSFKWQNNDFKGDLNNIVNSEDYYEMKLHEIGMLNLSAFLDKSNRNILNREKFDSDFPVIEKLGDELIVKNNLDIKKVSVTSNCAVELIFQKPAKGGGSLSIRINNRESSKSYIYSEYGNTPNRKYEVAKYAKMISELMNKEFKIIDGGYDC